MNLVSTMEWYIVVLVILLILLIIVLGMIIACMLSGQRCTISMQQRKPNYELTKIQQEEEEKKRKKFSSKFKRTFNSSSKSKQPKGPVEDVKTVELTLKLGSDDDNNNKISQTSPTVHEPSTVMLPKMHITQAERDEREKRREAVRKKYNL